MHPVRPSRSQPGYGGRPALYRLESLGSHVARRSSLSYRLLSEKDSKIVSSLSASVLSPTVPYDQQPGEGGTANAVPSSILTDSLRSAPDTPSHANRPETKH